jgi:predicted SnoaL-like aldol condensation-catalyzing enzyme
VIVVARRAAELTRLAPWSLGHDAAAGGSPQTTGLHMHYFSRLASMAGLALLAACTSAPHPSSRDAAQADQKAQVVALLKSLETGDPAPASVINPNKYIQHNLSVGDGIAGLGAVLSALPKGSARANTIRVFQDGPFVFAHTDYNFFGPKIGFDVFRFENGKIVEHWDNLQEKPAKLNPSGRSMIDGTTTITDRELTAANKSLVRAFVDDILVNGRMDRIASFIDGENYLQHNPAVGDGLSGLGAALEAMAKAGMVMKYDRVHKVLGEGNFVLAISEGQFGGKHVAFYDLFRVQGGKIVEHWDVIEAIPPRAEWKNGNGKFGF